MSDSHQIPELADHWKSLDLANVLSQPAAFISISQCNSLYCDEGVQGAEKQWERGTLENTVRMAKACRKAGMHFFWVGYDVFRENYPKTAMDEAQYGYWTESFKSSEMTDEQKQWDADLVDDLRNLVQPEDAEFFEYAHQSSFVGTPLPLMLERAGIKTLIFCGIHMDWCIEGNARAARDLGYMPIVIGDCCSCQNAEDDVPTMNRLNNIVCPVLSTDQAIALLKGNQADRVAA